MARQIDGVALGTVFAGSLFLYAGVKGYSVPQALQALIKGQAPASAGQAYPITTSGPMTAPGLSGLADAMLRYVGKVPYVWGGASPRGWDCSGSCNYVACHDMNLPIPGYAGGKFDGSSHGPATLTWLAWASAGHLEHIKSGQEQASDLVIWQTHMGIVIGNGNYVSAYDTQEGTVVKPIHGGGPIGEIASFWRYRPAPNPLTGVTT